MVKFRSGVAALAVLTVLTTPLSTHAGFILTLQEDTTTQTFTYGGPSLPTEVLNTGTLTFGDFAIQADIATTNSASGTMPAMLTINQLSVRNNAAGARTLTITVQDTDFTAPFPGDVHLTSELSTTSLTNAGDSVQFQSFLNGSGGTLLTLAAASSGTSADDIQTIGGTSYTLANITTLSVSANGLLQSTGTTEVTPAPEPSTLIMAGTGVVMGLGYWLRRKAQAIA